MKTDEFNTHPEEFSSPGNAFSPPGPEFADRGPEFADRGPEFAENTPEFTDRGPVYQKSGRKKKLFYSSASVMLLLTMLILEPGMRQPAVPTDPVIVDLASEVNVQDEEITVPVDPDPPEEAVEEHELPPSCEPIFFSFSDELNAKLIFTNPEAILSVRAELWDSIGGTLEQAWDIEPENILGGEYELPDMMDTFSMYMAHHESFDANDVFPVPELRVSMVCVDGDQQKTVDMVQPVTEELGWGIRDRGDEIVFRTYESEKAVDLSVRTDNAESALNSLSDGDFLILVEINGNCLDENDCRIEHESEVWTTSEGEDVTYHYSSLHIPKRAEGNCANITVYQKLTGYDSIWSRTVEVKY